MYKKYNHSQVSLFGLILAIVCLQSAELHILEWEKLNIKIDGGLKAMVLLAFCTLFQLAHDSKNVHLHRIGPDDIVKGQVVC